MSGKTLAISKPERKKKGKTLRSPRPSTQRQTKEERYATMEEIEKFFEEHNIRENIREEEPKNKNKGKEGKERGKKKGRRNWGMKTRKVQRK